MPGGKLNIIIFVLSLILLSGCKKNDIKKTDSIHRGWRKITRSDVVEQKDVPVYSYRITAEYPHDTTAFTEGFLMDGGFLYESTGLNGRSRPMKIDLETGKILMERKLEPQYFGEGIAILNEKIFQLTYKANIGFVYDKNTFEIIDTFYYPTQGWGFTSDGKNLIMSDGTEILHFIDPHTLKQTRYIVVSDGRGKIGYINELEYVDGKIFANVWTTDFIAIISPQTGKILGWVDLTGIYPERTSQRNADVLNGIAYNERTKRLLVTGKNWKKIFEIEIIQGKNKR